MPSNPTITGLNGIFTIITFCAHWTITNPLIPLPLLNCKGVKHIIYRRGRLRYCFFPCYLGQRSRESKAVEISPPLGAGKAPKYCIYIVLAGHTFQSSCHDTSCINSASCFHPTSAFHHHGVGWCGQQQLLQSACLHICTPRKGDVLSSNAF